ncbi:MAG: methyltransferase [Erythrobacter sp.]|jgi:predicted methyltransferase|uniref:class I SAM-dependent methyltransferase n=1 Tax=Erythrobacter sp. TaxID=1042 RepID=UPI002B482938|nr:methyltransferase [Erythrobacter sp.]WRH69917.1 MAG: methyltransferase [Erythrobacter sp.]
MNKLILAAAASGLAFAAPLMAQHAGHAAHADHGAETDAHIRDTANFMKHHGEQVAAAINHPTRAEDRLRDAYRRPAETLAFFHVGPHMKVGEYSPGGGWYTRLLGHYLGAEGKLVGIFVNPVSASSDPARQQRVRDAAAGFGKEVAGYTGLPAEHFSGITLDNLEGQKGTFDRILLMRALHNPLRMGILDTELRAMRELLKDDGLIGIEQHRARADAPWSYANGTKGYLRQEDVIDIMRINGFELVASSEILANPKDTADHKEGVWEMPPTLATKREDLKGLGESDRMTLLFKKAK